MGKKKGKRDVFQRFADVFFRGNRALAQALFFVGLFTVPPAAIGVLILASILLPEDTEPPARRSASRSSAAPKYQAAQTTRRVAEPPARTVPGAGTAQAAAPAAEPARAKPAKPAKPKPPARPAPPLTGNPEADPVIAACHSFRYDAEAILPEMDDLEVRARAQQTIAQVKGIQDWLVSQPDTAKGAQRLADYYLPTTLKLLRTYISVDNNPGPNAKSICKEIDHTLAQFNDALATLQNDLLDSTALDVAAEIRAMESMLGSEGLVSEFRIPTPGGEDQS